MRPINKTIEEFIRENPGLTLKQMAEQSGHHVSYVWKIATRNGLKYKGVEGVRKQTVKAEPRIKRGYFNPAKLAY